MSSAESRSEAREAMERRKRHKRRENASQRLEASGVISSRHEGKTGQNIFALGAESLDDLDALVAHIEGASRDEKLLWRDALVYKFEYGLEKSKGTPRTDLFKKRMAVYPLLAVIVSDNLAYDPVGLANRIMHESEIVAGKHGGIDDDYRMLRAAVILAGIYAYKTNLSMSLQDAPDAEQKLPYISANIDEVERVLPELVARTSTDLGLIEELLSSESTALSEGIL